MFLVSKRDRRCVLLMQVVPCGACDKAGVECRGRLGVACARCSASHLSRCRYAQRGKSAVKVSRSAFVSGDPSRYDVLAAWRRRSTSRGTSFFALVLSSVLMLLSADRVASASPGPVAKSKREPSIPPPPSSLLSVVPPPPAFLRDLLSEPVPDDYLGLVGVLGSLGGHVSSLRPWADLYKELSQREAESKAALMRVLQESAGMSC